MSDRGDLDGSVGRIRELLGEMSGTVKAINQGLSEHKLEFRSEIRGIKDDQRNIETTYSKQLDLLNGQARDMERTVGAISTQVTSIAGSFGELKTSVDQLNNFKQRLFTFGAAAATIFGIASYVIGPFASEGIKHLATKLFGS